MTEKTTPPPGKTWLTVELDSEEVRLLSEVDIWDLDIVQEVRGEAPEDPSDKVRRLLAEAEDWFRSAANSFTNGADIVDAPSRMMAGCRVLADALKASREEL